MTPKATIKHARRLLFGSIALGLLGLAGYLPGLSLLGSIHPTFIPMAPSTAISFIIVSSCIIFYNMLREPSISTIVMTVAVFLVSTFGILELFEYIYGIDLNFEDSLIPKLGTLNGVPVGRMSPSTGVLFFLSGLSALFLFAGGSCESSKRNSRQIASVVACLVSTTSIIFLLGYVYGTPLMYDQKTIPMALTTAAGFAFLGFGLILSTGTDCFPMRYFSGNSTPALLNRSFLPLIAIIVLIHGVLGHFPQLIPGVNKALWTAGWAVIYILVAGMVIHKVAKSIGSKIDLSEQALRNSEEQLREIVAKAPFPMVIVQSNGDIEFYNESFISTFGFTLDDVSTADEWWTTVYPDPDYRRKVQQSWEDASEEAKATGKSIAHQTWNMQRKDGGTRTVEFKVVPLGNISIIAMSDLTDRLEMERQLVQTSKMESIGQLAAGMAHEINTPTQFIQHNLTYLEKGYAEIMDLLETYAREFEKLRAQGTLERIPKSLQERISESDLPYLRDEFPGAFTQSLDGLKQIAHIVKSVKMFAHPASSERMPTDINSILEAVVTVSTNEWKYHSEIHKSFDDSIPPVSCIVGQINQAFLNLVVNAAHTNSDKVLSGDGKRVGLHISSRREDNNVVIEIRDEGMGIPEEYQDKIFDMFFSTKAIGKGTGQGLALTYRTIVDEHGGSIDFKTTQGEGTTFIVKLPL